MAKIFASIIVVLVVVGLLMWATGANEEVRYPIRIDAPGKPMVIVQTDSPQYEQVRDLVGGTGTQYITLEQWAKLEEIFGEDLDAPARSR